MVTDNIIARAKCALGDFKMKYPNYKIAVATIGGSHAYGFASDTSDVDIVGCYVIPTEDYFVYDEQNVPPDNIRIISEEYNTEIHMHELSKFVGLLIQPNLNMLDALFVPQGHIVEADTDVYKRLKEFGELAVSKAAFPHVQGMIIHMRKHRLVKYNEYDPKKQLYIFREIMRGIIMMETGRIVNNIMDLKDYFPGETEALIRFLILKKRNHEYLGEDDIAKINESELALETRLLNSKEFGIVRERPHDSLRKESSKFIKEVRRKNYEERVKQ